MKKLLLLLLLVAGGVSTASAGAQWIGYSYINVNTIWYQAHGTSDWASGGAFDEKDLGSILSLSIGGQIQIADEGKNWEGGAGDWMHYIIDEGETGELSGDINIAYSGYGYGEYNNNMLFQSGGSTFSASEIDISSLSYGEHTLTVYFGPIDEKYENGGNTATEYTATFTKAKDISGATVTGVNSSYEWSGSAIKPVPTVTYSETTLSSSTDYDVAYSEGCINVGTYTVTITGKGDYAGTKEVNYDILVPTGYYLVGTMNSWELNSNYKLTQNTENTSEYYINNVALSASDELKVVRTDDGKTKNAYYPGGDNYTNSDAGTYFVYFRPDGKGGDGWYYGNIYATTTASVNVALAPAGYGTYYNSVCEVTLPTGTVAYILTDGSPSYTPTYVEIANGDDDTKTVPAGTAVMLYSASSPVTLTLNTATTDDRTFDSNKLHGSDVATTTTGGDKYYKLTYGSASGYEGRFGWYWGADNGAAFTSPAHKVWLALSAASARTFFGLPGDDVTGINSLTLSKGEGVAFDLQGRRVANPTKGLYIVNGKKVIMK